MSDAEFADFFTEHYAKLQRFVAGRLGQADRHMVEDVVADAFVMCLMALREHGEKVANPVAYLYAIAYNELRRTMRGIHAQPMALDELVLWGAEDPRASTEESVVARVRAEDVLRALTDQQRQVMQLTIDGYSGTEIGTILGLSHDQVRHELRRARRRARAYVGAPFAGEVPDDAPAAEAEREESDASRLAAAGLRNEARRVRRRDQDSAESLYWRASAAGDTAALLELAEMREGSSEYDVAELAYRRAADAGESTGLMKLARLREKAGDHAAAERLFREAADAGNPSALVVLAGLRNQAGDVNGAVRLAREAAQQGNSAALSELAWRRELAGDLELAEKLYSEALAAGDKSSRTALARLCELAGAHAAAEKIARSAAAEGDTAVLNHLAKARAFAGDFDSAEALYLEAAAREEDKASLFDLAKLRAERGNLAGAEQIVESITCKDPANRTVAGFLRRLKLQQTEGRWS